MAIEKGKPIWISLTLFILLSNYLLYQSTLGTYILSAETNGAVLGSILDLIILVPLLVWLTLRKKSIKTAVILALLGCLVIKMMIPSELLQPFTGVIWVALIIEGIVLLYELYLIVTLILYIPKIINHIQESSEPVVFSFFDAISKYSTKNIVIQMLCAEFLMLYYALFTWRKKTTEGITLYKNTSYMPFIIMILHAIILETAGIHFWLHGKSTLLSISLLIFNIYSVLFFLADMNALRLNPVVVKGDTLYLSMGLMKRAKISLTEIDYVSRDVKELNSKLNKQTVQFIVKEFQEGQPQMILYMKQPVTVTLIMGFEKKYNKIAIQCDQPDELIHTIHTNIPYRVN